MRGLGKDQPSKTYLRRTTMAHKLRNLDGDSILKANYNRDKIDSKLVKVNMMST